LQDSTNDQLTGHAPPTIGRRYGEGVELPVLAKELDKLDFEFIDWEPILRAVRVEGPPRWRTEGDHRRPNEWSTRDTSNLTSESLNLAAVAVDQSADPPSLSLFD
jgi:hypothetical protein